jgi:predicted regulator of Ras-like GTPase activity (Roadblock/LC7/MglB family)
MTSATAALAAEALGELRRVTSQLRAVVVVDASGERLASADLSPPETASGARVRALADAAPRLWSMLANVAGEHVAQAEISTTAGSVFLVAENGHVVAATTGPDPAAGLAFYDLRTILRRLTGRDS